MFQIFSLNNKKFLKPAGKSEKELNHFFKFDTSAILKLVLDIAIIYCKKKKENKRKFQKDSVLFRQNQTQSNLPLFKMIKNTFCQITNKECDIVDRSRDDNVLTRDFVYKIIYNDVYMGCSSGEEELLDFLTQYYSDDLSIIFVDEPCSHLSSQNKSIYIYILL